MPIGEALSLLAALFLLMVSVITAGFAGIFIGDTWRTPPGPQRRKELLIGFIGGGVLVAIGLAMSLLGALLWQDWRPALIPPAVVLIAAAVLRRPQPRQPWEESQDTLATK